MGPICRKKIITKGLKIYSFQQAKKLVTAKNADHLKMVYEIKNVLILSQACQQLISLALDEKNFDGGDPKEHPEIREAVGRKCAFQKVAAELTLCKLNLSIDQYKTFFPNNYPHAFLKIASFVAILVGANTTAQILLPNQPELSKLVAAGGAAATLPILYADKIVPRIKGFFSSKAVKKTPYHVVAEGQINKLMTNML